MQAQEYLEGLRREIEALCRQYGVVRLRLFGSSVRSDWDPETSDFDFVAEFAAPPEGLNGFSQLMGFIVSLEDLVKRPVDVVDWNAVKKPYFREAVEAEAQDWYAA